MNTVTVEFFVIFVTVFRQGKAIIGPPVKCHGPVPKITKGKYYFHDNDTYLLRVSTNVELKLNLHQRSCFQVDIAETEKSENETGKVDSLFYSVRYVAYQQTYDIRSSYQFGIAELQTFCRCDCPKGDNFCDFDFGKKDCSKGEICVTRYHDLQENFGCPNSGPADLCCEISVKPYENRKFTAISLVDPRPQTQMEIEIYASYQEKWALFRRYSRTVLPYRVNTLRLNGYENVAEMFIRASADPSRFYLKNGDKWYFFEDKPEFQLIDDRRVNGLFERDANKFGWLRFENGQWDIDNPKVTLHNLHQPFVTDCKNQKYTDTFEVNAAGITVIRNSSGAINAKPFVGVEVSKKQRFVDKVHLSRSNWADFRDRSLTVSFKPAGAPTLNLNIKLHQKMSVVAHMYSSYLEDFAAQICLDKHANRYLNITLTKSYGEFAIEVFRDQHKAEMDLVLSMVTNLPFATNYTEILPLPGFVSSSRLVCVFAANKPKNRLCKWATFVKEPIDWFQLKTVFISSEGSCPGCNKETFAGSFWNNLNPKNWLDGISSFSEGIAFALEVFLYCIFLVVFVAIWRRCLYPLVKWALCDRRGRVYEMTKDAENL